MERNNATRIRPLAVVVRVWAEDDAVVLRGEVEHVYTGERRLFQAYDALVALIERWRADAHQDVLLR